jgi:hypothetical protein
MNFILLSHMHSVNGTEKTLAHPPDHYRSSFSHIYPFFRGDASLFTTIKQWNKKSLMR